MEAPRGVQVSGAKGPLKVGSRKDLHLESTEGEVGEFIHSFTTSPFWCRSLQSPYLLVKKNLGCEQICLHSILPHGLPSFYITFSRRFCLGPNRQQSAERVDRRLTYSCPYESANTIQT